VKCINPLSKVEFWVSARELLLLIIPGERLSGLGMSPAGGITGLIIPDSLSAPLIPGGIIGVIADTAIMQNKKTASITSEYL
jgi:hypothetical protein